EALVSAVVPFDQVGLDHRPIAEAGQLAGLAGTAERARDDEREHLPRERRPEPLGEPAPVVGEGGVRRPGVLAAEAPRGLPVSDGEHPHAGPRAAQTLSASVELEPAAAAASPHFQPAISGMSSPRRLMCSLCCRSLSRMACLA